MAQLTRSLTYTETSYPNWASPKSSLRANYQAFLNAPAMRVFEAFADVEQFCRLVPGLQQIELCDTEWGLVRRCDFGNDMIVEQQIIHCEPPSAFAYAVTMPNPLGVRDHYSVISCLPEGSGTRLQWLHYFEHDDLDAMLTMLESMFEHMLAGLMKQYDGQRLPNRFKNEELQKDNNQPDSGADSRHR